MACGALYWLIKFREVLLMSESGCLEEIRTVHLGDFADHARARTGADSKGKKALLEAIEREVA